ncbi:ATP-binding cassette domain-containing protein, partial [Desulfofundulus sp.]|uniref:ATP-binding cassette domain-containing protein n=1 Tax=Desulfofundulus sp. TaxID=2282750 RepID=UPI003C772810
MLEVKEVSVAYGVIEALKGISFSVNKGEIVALIGANGAGKTTTLRTISGLLRARKGQIFYKGRDITKLPPYKIVELGLTQVPEGRRVFS